MQSINVSTYALRKSLEISSESAFAGSSTSASSCDACACDWEGFGALCEPELFVVLLTNSLALSRNVEEWAAPPAGSPPPAPSIADLVVDGALVEGQEGSERESVTSEAARQRRREGSQSAGSRAARSAYRSSHANTCTSQCTCKSER